MPQDKEHESTAEPEVSVARTAELEAIRELNGLPESLGFVESQELGQLRAQLVERVATDVGEAGDLVSQYRAAAEEIVNRVEGPGYARAQIGLNIRMALIWRDGGQTDRYLEDLQDAATYAWNMQEDEVVAVLDAALNADRTKVDSEEEDAIEPSGEQLAQACSDVLSPEDCEELAGMSIEDGTGYAFSLLLENGVDDPENFLREKGILE